MHVQTFVAVEGMCVRVRCKSLTVAHCSVTIVRVLQEFIAVIAEQEEGATNTTVSSVVSGAGH